MTVPDDNKQATKPPLEMDGHLVAVEISGNIWKLLVEPGKKVALGDPLVIIEAMKMEITVAGTVRAIHYKPGRPVSVGGSLMVIIVLE